MKRPTVIADVVISTVLVCLVAFTLLPAVARIERSASDAKCQSNLQRWAEAIDLYLVGNYNSYPTNRPFVVGGGLGVIMSYVNLSPDEIDPSTGKPRRFVYGLTWVEALYPFLWDRAERTAQDWKSFRQCPNANTAAQFPSPPSNALVTYVFNRNLSERSWAEVQTPRKTMVMREFGRLTVSMLRPMNDSAGGAGSPMCPFLNTSDCYVPDTSQECRLHGQGSYIVFADGHVCHFTLDFYPGGGSWDPETQQWWNFAPNSGKGPPYLKSIAITP
jgi:prepilin-type processing-associated H-X9-DG protein